MVLTIDDMDIPRKRSASPVLPRSPLVPQDGDSSMLPGEGGDAFKVVGEDSKMVMAIDDMDIPRNRSTSPDQLSPAVNEDSKVPVMTVDEMDIPRKPSGVSARRTRSPPRRNDMDIPSKRSTSPDRLSPTVNESSKVPVMTVDEMDIPRKPSGVSARRTRSPRRRNDMDIPSKRSTSPDRLSLAVNEDSKVPVMTVDEMDIPRKPSGLSTRRTRSPRSRKNTINSTTVAPRTIDNKDAPSRKRSGTSSRKARPSHSPRASKQINDDDTISSGPVTTWARNRGTSPRGDRSSSSSTTWKRNRGTTMVRPAKGSNISMSAYDMLVSSSGSGASSRRARPSQGWSSRTRPSRQVQDDDSSSSTPAMTWARNQGTSPRRARSPPPRASRQINDDNTISSGPAMTWERNRGTSPRRARSPPPRERKDDNSSIGSTPSMTWARNRGTSPRRARSPPPREPKDDNRSTVSDLPMTVDDINISPRKPSSEPTMMWSRIRGTSPRRSRSRKKRNDNGMVDKPNSTPALSWARIRGTSPRRSRSPKRRNDDGEGDDTFDVVKAKDNQRDAGGGKSKKNNTGSFSLSGGPLFRSNSRKYLDKFHDIPQDEVSELGMSTSQFDFASDDFVPTVRGNNTGLSAQVPGSTRSQLESDGGNSPFGADGKKSNTVDSGMEDSSEDNEEEETDFFNLAPMTAETLARRRQQLEEEEDSSTLGRDYDTLEPVEPMRGVMSKMVSLNLTDEGMGGGIMTAEALIERRKQLEAGSDDSSTLGRDSDSLESVESKSVKGLSKMVSFSVPSRPISPGRKTSPKRKKDSLGRPISPGRKTSPKWKKDSLGRPTSLVKKTSPKRKKDSFGFKGGVSDDEDELFRDGLDNKSSFSSHSGINMAGGIGVGGAPFSPLQVSRRRIQRRRDKRGGMVTTPSALNVGEVLSNPFDVNDPANITVSHEDLDAIDRAHMRRASVASVISASELSQETDLHRALADEDATLDQLKYLLQGEPASASIHDKEGKLPLHIVAENEELHLNLGQTLDDFILEVLVNRNRRAPITPNYAGDYPFVPAIREWVDHINEVADFNIPDLPTFVPGRPKKDPKPRGRGRMSVFGKTADQPLDSDDSSELGLELNFVEDIENQRKREEIIRDLAEHLIPWNVFIDDHALWSIDMLSMFIEREPLKATWTSKIVDVIAGIPCFLKTVLLIEDDDQRKHVLQSRLLREVMLHEKSMGPWLVYLITSDDEVAQDRAVMYLQLMTIVEAEVSKESRRTFSSRISGAAFTSADGQLIQRKDKVYSKAADLPGIIPAFMQFNTDNFSKCSTTSVVQYILDKKLFEPKSLSIILFDGFFLTLAVILFTMCSNEVFKLISNMRYSPMVVFTVNQTAYNLCQNGTLSRDDHTCLYYNERQAYSEPYNLGSVSLFRPVFDCDMECQVCRGMNDFGEPESRGPSGGSGSTGASVVSYSGDEIIDEDSIFTCYAIGDRYAIDTFLFFCIMALTFNCLYFLSRSLAAWVRVPRKYLAGGTFMIFTLVDTLSIIFPVTMVGLFITFIYQTDRFTLLDKGIYVPLKVYDIWMQEAEILSFFSATCIGFLYLKILMYFKVLNEFTATFIFALGEVVKDIFWFFWIMVVIILAFSQMFYTTLSCNEGFCPAGDLGQFDSPYNSFGQSLLKTYSILLGEFDLDRFDSPFTSTLFLIFTFAVVIIVLNFLIAIVGDSYDKSMTKIETHFGRARLMFMVELSAFQTIAKVPFRVKKQNYRRFLLAGNWKGCFMYLILSGCLVGGFLWLIMYKDLLTNSSTTVVLMISSALALMIAAPFIWKSGVISFLVHSPLLNPLRKTIGRFLIYFFRLVLGKSILSERTQKEKKDWGGRMKHIVTAIDEKIRESESMTLNTIAENDEQQNKMIEKIEVRMEYLEEDVADMKKMLIKIHQMLEERE